ncbi:hypothetical protein O3P69_011043 [Scylla paramamosain]|uniref:Troponin I n=2 Tax=Scylla paramamosain TaxID=85552 RepID=A0AAW0SSY7_SCYPA
MSDEEAKRKQDEINKRKAEVRKRLEEQSQKKAKKGFMTPERKKKLRLLLRKKAAEELKKEQERKAAERRKIIDQRCGQPKNLDGANEDDLRAIIKKYYDHCANLESEKYDIEMEIMRKDYEINELNIQVNDLRGKFIKPTLKKVSKYENKFAKLQKKAAEFNFRNQLKTVKKKEFELEDDKEKTTKPGWAAGGPGAAKKEGEEGAHPAEGEATAEEGGEGAPAEGAPAEETPAEGAPEGAPQEAPAEGAPAEGTAEAAPAEGGEAPPAEGAPADAPAEAPAEPAAEAPAEAAPAEAAPPAEGDAPPAQEA